MWGFEHFLCIGLYPQGSVLLFLKAQDPFKIKPTNALFSVLKNFMALQGKF